MAYTRRPSRRTASPWTEPPVFEVGLDRLARDPAAQVDRAAVDLPDRLLEVGHSAGLQQVPRHARAKGLENEVRIGEHRQQHRPRVRRDFHDLLRGVDPVEKRHRDVEHRDIGAMLADEAHGLVAVAGFPHDLKPVSFQ